MIGSALRFLVSKVMATRPKVPIYEETYDEWLRDCDNFRRHRGYVDIPLTAEEENFPLAFRYNELVDLAVFTCLINAYDQCIVNLT